MASGKSLTDEENRRVREGIVELLRRPEMNQSKLAPLLGLTQSAVAGIRSGRQGSSYPVALAVARLLGKRPGELLDIPPEQATAPVLGEHPDDHPNVNRARRMLAAGGFLDELAAIADFPKSAGFDPPSPWWVIEYAQKKVAGTLPRPTPREELPVEVVPDEVVEEAAKQVVPRMRRTKKTAATRRG